MTAPPPPHRTTTPHHHPPQPQPQSLHLNPPSTSAPKQAPSSPQPTSPSPSFSAQPPSSIRQSPSSPKTTATASSSTSAPNPTLHYCNPSDTNPLSASPYPSLNPSTVSAPIGFCKFTVANSTSLYSIGLPIELNQWWCGIRLNQTSLYTMWRCGHCKRVVVCNRCCCKFIDRFSSMRLGRLGVWKLCVLVCLVTVRGLRRGTVRG